MMMQAGMDDITKQRMLQAKALSDEARRGTRVLNMLVCVCMLNDICMHRSHWTVQSTKDVSSAVVQDSSWMCQDVTEPSFKVCYSCAWRQADSDLLEMPGVPACYQNSPKIQAGTLPVVPFASQCCSPTGL